MKYQPIIFGIIFILAVGCSKESDNQIRQMERTTNSNSISQARSDVEKLISMLPLTKASAEPRRITDTWSTSIETRSSETQHEVYVFNFNDSLGYALVSSDTRIGLIGLALEGTFDRLSNITNPGLIITLSNAQTVLSEIDTSDTPFEPEYQYGEWENVFYSPMYGYCPVKWGQLNPYNQYCPFEDSTRAYTGCVATAVAQLMSIYKYPAHYSSFSFNWNDMITDPFSTDYLGNYSVGILMRQLGTPNNLDMQYSTNGSSANPENIPRTLENFGFSNGGTLCNYASYAVINELQSGYPILIGGFDTRYTTIKTNIFGRIVDTSVSYGGGHRWLAHGLLDRRRPVYHYEHGSLVESYYEDYYYILCNFGWDGDSDGYYADWVFDTPAGPVYDESIITRGTTTTTECDSLNFKYHITTVLGIRK